MNFCSLACGLTLELPEKTNTPCGPALEFYQWTEPPAPGTLSDKPLQPSSCYLIFKDLVIEVLSSEASLSLELTLGVHPSSFSSARPGLGPLQLD